MLEALARISSGQRLSSTEEKDALDQLEAHECWQPLFRYLDQVFASGSGDLEPHYRRLIRVRLRYFDDVAGAQALAADLIRRCRLDFSGFRVSLFNEQTLPGLAPNEEAALLEAASEAFSAVQERSHCLEKLAAVYEKRLFNEVRLGQVFERLIKLDPDNVKALRYFKLAYSQNSDWEQVARILKRLIQVVQVPQEKFRLAHDLAYSLVYHLDQPRDALLVLDRYCRESPLDVSQIEFDAAYKTGDIDRCIKVLQNALRSVRDDAGRAIVQFRMAGLLRQAGQLKECEKYLRQSIASWPVFLDPFEMLIQLQIEGRRWREIEGTLQELGQRVSDQELSSQIEQAVHRIRAGRGGQS